MANGRYFEKIAISQQRFDGLTDRHGGTVTQFDPLHPPDP